MPGSPGHLLLLLHLKFGGDTLKMLLFFLIVSNSEKNPIKDHEGKQTAGEKISVLHPL